MMNPFENRPLIADSILETVGYTPCVRLNRVAKENQVLANIIMKMESFEPCNSVKDRIAKHMILAAEARGDIKPGHTILIEPTSGNTGIGIAMVAAARGYEAILIMSENMSMERRVMLKALGATVILTPGPKGFAGLMAKANEVLANSGGRGFMLQQFENPDNPETHINTTGPEIWYQTEGKVDIFISGIGSGGTMTGVSRFLKKHNPDVRVIAVEPLESSVLSGNRPGPHGIQGIGAGIVPENFDRSLVDEIFTVPSGKALETAREVALKEGLLVGISSGAAIYAALQVGLRPENKDKNIVVIIPDFGERYLSTPLFADLLAEAAAQKPESVDHLL